jgi:FK506-binding protein 1
MILLFLIILSYLLTSETYSLSAFSSPGSWNQLRKRIRCDNMLDDSVDISPDAPGAVMKRVLRTGDASNGYPIAKDTVSLSWVIKLKDGTIAHKSNTTEPFSFTIGAEPREVILGWELCLPTMTEGEIASLVVKPSHAFGAKGVPPLVPPNETIICELELHSIIPSIKRTYRSVGLDESIKDELLDQIQSGNSMISSEVMGINSNLVNGTRTKENVKMFDEKKMKLDPNQRVSGEGRGHCWEETSRSIDIELPIPSGTKKVDIVVEIETVYLKVSLKNGMQIIQGPLHGKVSPSECMWALAEHDPKSRIKGEKIVVSLEKSYGSREIWATVFDRKFLTSNTPQQ